MMVGEFRGCVGEETSRKPVIEKGRLKLKRNDGDEKLKQKRKLRD